MSRFRKLLTDLAREGAWQIAAGVWAFASPYLPIVASLLMVGMLIVFVWLEALPTIVLLVFALVGMFATTYLIISLIDKCWFPIIKMLRRSGVSINLPRGRIGIACRKEMVGSKRDLVIWSDVEVRITGVDFKCFNFSAIPIENVILDSHSAKTNEKFTCYLDGMDPVTTYGIPGRCEFTINVRLPRSTLEHEGYSLDDFVSFCGDLVLTASLDGVEYVRTVRAGKVLALAFNSRRTLEQPPKDKPRVTKRKESVG